MATIPYGEDLDLQPGQRVEVKGQKLTQAKINATKTQTAVKDGRPVVVVPPPEPEPEPEPQPELPVIYGFGRHALDNLGTRIYEFSDAAGFLSGFAQLGSTVDILKVAPGAVVDVDLGARIRRLDGRADYLVDGRGGDVTLRNGAVWNEACHHYAYANVRNRGGWAGGQSADGFTNAGNVHDLAYVNVSVSGFGDEGISTTRGAARVTYQDIIIGSGMSAHNFGSLNQLVDGITIFRPVFIGLSYRQPQANAGLMDIVNAMVIDAVTDNYGFSLFDAAKVNSTNAYFKNVGKPVTKSADVQLWHTGTIRVNSGTMPTSYPTKHPIPAEYAVTAMPVDSAIGFAKLAAGCLPHDATDLASLAKLT